MFLKISTITRACGLEVWFPLRVREVPGSSPGSPPLNNFLLPQTLCSLLEPRSAPPFQTLPVERNRDRDITEVTQKYHFYLMTQRKNLTAEAQVNEYERIQEYTLPTPQSVTNKRVNSCTAEL